MHDMLAAVWGSPFVVDGKVYLGDEDGDVVVLQRGQGEEGAGRDEHGQRRLRDGGAGPRHAVPQQPQSAVRDREQVARSLRMRWLVFVLGAVLSWGAYGVLLHRGQVMLGNPLKALLCVGVAYFLIGVLIPVGALASQGSSRRASIRPD